VESPVKARVPASSSYNTAPKLNTSDRASSDLPAACSGDMYAGASQAQRRRASRSRAREPRDTEVEQFAVQGSALPKDHDIGRLQIAVKNAAFVRRVQCVGNLARQTNRLVRADGTAQRLSLEIFEDEVIGTDVVDLADVWMVDRGKRARFALESAIVFGDHPFDRNGAIRRTSCAL
jgi:hypothetical protein